MRVTSILAVATIALTSSVDRAAAAPSCTVEDLKKITAVSNSMLTDPVCLESKGLDCPNAKCYVLLERVTAEIPDCVGYNDKNMKVFFQKQLDDCKSSKGTTSAAAGRNTIVSAAVALGSTVLAVAMVYL